MELQSSIPGCTQLMEWCGGWPSFHDSEVIRLDLNRRATSRLVVHVLGGQRPTFGPRSDSRYAVPPEDIIVNFLLEEIEDVELNGFSHQNVIFWLSLEREADLFNLVMEPCYGLAGKITARKVSIEFNPGRPSD